MPCAAQVICATYPPEIRIMECPTCPRKSYHATAVPKYDGNVVSRPWENLTAFMRAYPHLPTPWAGAEEVRQDWYDVHRRPWYINQERAFPHPAISDPYVWFDGSVGVTATVPVVRRDGTMGAVVAADVRLEAVVEQLQAIKVCFGACCARGRDAWEGGRCHPPPPSRPLQGAQPMPSHCPPDRKCRLQWHCNRQYPPPTALATPSRSARRGTATCTTRGGT